jgi:predicted amidohydrolase
MSTVVACCQLAPQLGNLPANRELAAAAITDAAGQGAAVVVLPELMSSGYVFESQGEARALAELPDGPMITAWAQLAAEHDLVIVGGFCEAAGEDVFNSAALVDASGLRCVYRKAHLWDAEPRWFARGAAPPAVVTTQHGRIAVMICYDLEFPEWVRLAALDGAQLLCAPVNWPAYPRPDGERPAEVVRVQADAAVNRMFIAACDRIGPERGVAWVGGSVIVDADGWPLAGGSASRQPATLLAECDLGTALDKGVSPNNDVLGDRRPELYGRVAHTPS